MFNAVFVQSPDFYESSYGAELRAEAEKRVRVLGGLIDPKNLDARREDLERAEIVITGWGAPLIDDLLPLCGRLQAVLFAGGTTSRLLNKEIWSRGIVVSSSYVANAVPVAEYTLAAILFGLKGGWRSALEFKMERRYARPRTVPGAYRSTVGLISCGAIARELLRLLRSFDLDVLVYDPFVPDEEIRQLGAEPAKLEEIFAEADVISLHAPELDETQGMISGELLASMKPYATFVNTARGSIVRENELYEVAKQRTDLQFVLDVIQPEPPLPDSPLFDLPNVIVTPHIAGAMNGECRRMGRYMIEELDRHIKGQALRWAITPDLASRSIHRPNYMKNPDAIPVA